MDRSYSKTIRTAYVWLIIGVLILGAKPLFAAFSETQYLFHGAANHALAVGFVTLMIIGYASKMVPTFKGVDMHSITLANLSFYLINIGCFLRVYTQIMIGLSHSEDFYYSLIGFSGWIELTAIGIFGYNVWKTMNAEDEDIEEPMETLTEITGDTNIAHAIDQYPEILDVFLEFGFKQLASPVARKTVAKMFTIKQATKIHPVEIDSLLKALNERIKKL
jgi:heme/copper-type cytochrome/quinol oxidase subunit 1